MSDGEMLNAIKKLIESGDDFTVKQYRILTLSGMVELGDSIKDVKETAESRVCPEVKKAIKDIERLETKSNRNDYIVGFGAIVGAVIASIFGK